MSKKKAVRSKKKSFWCWIKRDWRLYAMLAVPIIWYLLFCYKPMVGLIIAFQKFNIFKGIAGSKFVGLENFKFVFGMRDFGIALRNTLWLNTLDLVFGFPVPIILAILLNEMRMMEEVLSDTSLSAALPFLGNYWWYGASDICSYHRSHQCYLDEAGFD